MKYFAYGSNMLTRRLTHPSRAPSACASGIAVAPGFVVKFHKIGMDGSGKCTLVSTPNLENVAYGVLYELADRDVAGLDRAEGVHTGGYVRCPINLRHPRGGTTSAMTYIADDRFVDSERKPFDWYRDLVVAGAKEHGLPARYIEEIARIPGVADADTRRSAQAHQILDGF